VGLSRANIVAGISVLVAIASLGIAGAVLFGRDRQLAPEIAASSPAASSAVTSPAADPSVTARAQAAAEYAKLNIPPRKAELISERATHLRDAVKKEDFAAAAAIAQAAFADSAVAGWDYQPFKDLAEDYPDLVDPDFVRHLDSWVAAQPGAPLPVVLRAHYHYRRGWLLRGSDFANKVPAEDMRSFGREMNAALDDAETAIRIDQGNPYAYFLRLRILHGGGLSKRLFDAFEDAIARYPGYYPLYTIMLDTLEPRWGGSTTQMRDFVDHFAGPAPAQSPVKLLYLDLYGRYLQLTAHGCWKAPKPQDCVAERLPDLATPALMAGVHDALQLYDTADPSPAGHYRFGLAIEPIFTQILSDWTADTYSGALLQLAATAMHSDTQLKQDNPGRNDYMIDKLLARSWLQKGYYENAIAKAGDALKDIAAATFPGEMEKDQAMAGIYVLMGEAYADLSQYPATIAAGQAAVALGGSNSRDHVDCFAFGRLQAYAAALDSCNAALARHPDNLSTFFWRARAYDELGRKDEALKDYALVAGSHNGFRGDAAIDMSMIYFARKDNQGALELLNGYPYLFDPDLSSENTVALAYNNRCYAYMELGDLQKALADCRQSLKYGSVPEAFRKEQELLKRLGETPAQDAAPKTQL